MPDQNPDRSLDRLKEIFQEAADKSTGRSRPLFRRLSNAFNAMSDAADIGSQLDFERAKLDFAKTSDDIALLAKTDPAAARSLIELGNAIAAENSGTKNPEPLEQKQPEPVIVQKKPKKHWNI